MRPDRPKRPHPVRGGTRRAGLVLLAVLALAVAGARPAVSSGRDDVTTAGRASQPAPGAVPAGAGPSAGRAPTAWAGAPLVQGSSAAVTPLPTSQHGFRFRETVVPMRFPLPAGARYSYVNDFLAPRVGVVYPYEHVRGRAADGTLLRAHDGVDVYVATGTPVLAPFSGTIVDPATRWKPWDRSRYGLVAVVVSDEAMSRGYAVLLVHLSRLAVRPGQHVLRGQRLGLTGRTGNAAETPAHLHVELRAPFLLVVRERGVLRRIDAFDPYPSLAAADPRHQ